MSSCVEVCHARLDVISHPEQSLPNPILLRAMKINAALEHRRQRIEFNHMNESDDNPSQSSRSNPVPIPNSRSLRSRNKKDSSRRNKGVSSHVNDGAPSQSSSTSSPVKAEGSNSTSVGSSVPPQQAKGGDIFQYVEDDDLHIALEDALACITDPQESEPREVLTDAASALAKMRLVHIAMFLRFAARLNTNSKRTEEEDADNYELFTNLSTLFNCADTQVVAAMLDIIAHKFDAESSALSKHSSRSVADGGVSVKEEADADSNAMDREWKQLPIISMDDADEFVPLSSSAGPMPADYPSKLVIEEAPIRQVVSTVDAEPGTVLHVLPGVVIRGEKYAVDEKTGKGELFTRGSCRSAGTYTVGCNFERTARIATNEDPVLREMHCACACNASLYLVNVADEDGDNSTRMTDDPKQKRMLAIIADAPISAREEVTLPQEMLWEACLVPPACFCASAQALAHPSSPTPPKPQPMSPPLLDETEMTDSSAVPEATTVDADSTSSVADDDSDVPVSTTTGSSLCALSEFFELRSHLFRAVLENGASSLLTAKPPQKRRYHHHQQQSQQQQQQQKTNQRGGNRSNNRSRTARSGRRGGAGSSRRKQARKRTLSPLMDPKPTMSREDRKLQAICETIKKLDEHPVSKRRHTVSDSSDGQHGNM